MCKFLWLFWCLNLPKQLMSFYCRILVKSVQNMVKNWENRKGADRIMNIAKNANKIKKKCEICNNFLTVILTVLNFAKSTQKSKC